MKDKEKDIITSADLHQEVNAERQKVGLHEIPAINSRSGGNSYARMDKSFKSAPDFFRQMFKKEKE